MKTVWLVVAVFSYMNHTARVVPDDDAVFSAPGPCAVRAAKFKRELEVDAPFSPKRVLCEPRSVR